MKTFYFYTLSDGRFSGASFSGHKKYLAANTPEGCAAKEGVTDFRRQRVDLSTGELVSCEADPSAIEKRFAALAEIERLERQQARPMRELARNPLDAEARRRIDEIDDQIACIREEITNAPGP